MKPLASLVFVILACSTTPAQTGSARNLDNFDFASGIRIERSAPTSQPKRGKRTAKLSATFATRAAAESASPKTLTRPTSMVVATRSLDGFTTGDANVDNLIVESGSRNGVDPLLLYAVMHQESTFKTHAVSPKGARGLMQLMPGTAARYGVTNIFDSRQNIEGGARYMRFLLDLFDDDVELALAGYNAGENAVLKFGNRVPPYSETQEYVRRISRRYALMRDPFTARTASQVTRAQLAAVRGKEPVPLTVYERSVYAVRLPDGRLQLVSQ